MTEEQKPIISPEEEASDEEFRAAMAAAEKAASPAAGNGTQSQTAVTSLDSLQGNEFAVELDGVVLKGIFRVSGLTTFKLTGGGISYSPIVLAKMVQRDASLPFNQWLRETITAGNNADRPTRRLAIVAIDDGEETRRWTLNGAYITEVRYTDFDTSSSDLVEEMITISYESMVETWTWSDRQ